MRSWRVRAWAWAWAWAFGLSGASWGGAQTTSPVWDRIQKTGQIRVCVWPQYLGISHRHPWTQMLHGLDIDMAQALAQDLQVRAIFVDSDFTTFAQDLNSQRCDVAMFAIAVTPERQSRLRFTQAYFRSDIYALVIKGNRVIQQWADIDRPGVRVAVQQSTFVETAWKAKSRFAEAVSVGPGFSVRRELEAGRVDAVLTDYPFSVMSARQAHDLRVLEPPQDFALTPYAYAVSPQDALWWRKVDDFVVKVKQDGRLMQSALKHDLAFGVAP